jgi:methionyl-tRNA formyltransferase
MELFRLYGPGGFAKLLAIQLRERAASALRVSRLSKNAHSIAELAELRGIPYYSIGNPNLAENFNAIESCRPDVLVSVACPFLLKRPMLEMPKVAAINIHHAPLPRYKGMMPTFWQMYHGERSTGVTVHTMAEKIDEGKIVYQESLPIIPGETMHDLIRRSKRAGARAMLHVLHQYASGVRLNAIEPSVESSYFTFPTADEMRTFRQRGLRAI